MKSIEIQKHDADKKTESKDAREGFVVQKDAPKALIVSEFERAPLTDVNFGF
ncbi:Hypothetical protein A7982_07460 [Minicystis rosea]|nr:Hypothetical protein A7982_07460 [Minicystis rosea]